MKAIIVGDQPLFRLALIQLLQRIEPKIYCDEYSGLADLPPRMNPVSLLIMIEKRLQRGEQLERINSVKQYDANMQIIWITEQFGTLEQHYLEEGVISLCLPKRIDCDCANNYIALLLRADSNVFAEQSFQGFLRKGLFTRDTADLTVTQLKVLRGLERGDFNKQLADSLNLSLHTIKAHLTSIYRILGVSSRVQAALVSKGIPACSRFAVDLRERFQTLDNQ